MKDIDVWDINLSAREYVRLAREAKGPEKLHSIFIEARTVLSDVDYGFFYEMVEEQAELLLAIGGQVVKPVVIRGATTS